MYFGTYAYVLGDIYIYTPMFVLLLAAELFDTFAFAHMRASNALHLLTDARSIRLTSNLLPELLLIAYAPFKDFCLRSSKFARVASICKICFYLPDLPLFFI